jgi:hypothetical protein
VTEPEDGEFLDDEFLDEGDEERTPIRRFEQSAAGAIVAASMNGLHDAMFGPREKEEVQVVSDWSGDPPFTDPYVLRLDPDHPEDSIVMVRPWLHDGDAGVQPPAGEAGRSSGSSGSSQDDTSTRRPSRADT